MNPLKSVFVKIGVCVALYCLGTTWHFYRRGASLTDAYTESLHTQLNSPLSVIKQPLSPYSLQSDNEPSEQPEKPVKSIPSKRILFVKEEEKK